MRTIFIDNQWHESANGKSIALLNPSNGAELKSISWGTTAEVNQAVESARLAFDNVWSGYTAVQRGRLLHKLSRLLLSHQEELAQLESDDCGKPLAQARADAAAIARYFEFYAGACDKLHGETIPFEADYTVMTWREPHGVTAHIVPWNYPMQIFGRCVAAALAAGNTCVVKPSEDACLSLLRVVDLAHEAGFPPGVLNLVTGYGYEVGNDLVSHADVNHISFTGSPSVGSIVAQAAAVNHTPVTLELGGKSPQIVFADSNLDEVLPAVIRGLIQNAGQTCSAGSRLLLERSIYNQFMDKLSSSIQALNVGPADQDPDCGPLIRANQLSRVQGIVQSAVSDGLTIAAQAQISSSAPEDGFYFAPTVFKDVPYDHSLAQEEVFGPVLAATPFNTEEEAIQIANSTNYGLVAGVWTQNGARQMRMARKLRCGQVFINNYGAAGGIELPFGGVKSSGYGREKGFEALYGFTQLKTVAIKH